MLLAGPQHFVQLVQLLRTVHQTARLVHRDVSVSNLFAYKTENEEVKVPYHRGHETVLKLLY
jgi:hypothetical protein